MKAPSWTLVKEPITPYDVPFLGEMCLDYHLEVALGDVIKLRKNDVVEDMEKVVLDTPVFRLPRGVS